MGSPSAESTRVPSWAIRRLGGLLVTAVLVAAALRGLRAPQRSASLTVPASPETPRRWPTLVLALASFGGAALWTLGGVPGPVGAVAAVAVAWLVLPLAWARWTGDEALVTDLLAERRRSGTVLLLCAAGRLAAAVGALAAGLYLLPLALGGYMLAESFSGRLVTGSERHTNLALVCLALAGVAWAAYPLAAGFCAARGGTPGGVTGRLARTVRWGGRSVTSTVARLRRRWKVTLALLSTSLLALALVAGIYALVGVLARGDAFEKFRLYDVDPDHVAIGAAVGVLVMVDMLAWGRQRSEGAASAMAMVVAAMAIGLAGFGVSAGVLAASGALWGVPRGVIAGVAFGAGVAALMDLAQAVLAGAMALGRRRGKPEYVEVASVNKGWYTVGEALGAGALREWVARYRRQQAVIEAETVRRRLLKPVPEAGLQPLLGAWGMPLVRAACVATTPLVFVVAATAAVPHTGLGFVPWGLLLVMGLLGFMFWMEMLWMGLNAPGRGEPTRPNAPTSNE